MNNINRILQDIRPGVDFTNTLNYLDHGLLDSFDIITLVAALDETYNISIDGCDIVPENFANLESIARLVEKYGGAA